MTDLTTLLKDSDPVRENGELSLADAQRMRRAIVAAALEPAPVRTLWQRPFAFAGVGTLLVVVGTMAGHRVTGHGGTGHEEIVVQAPAPATVEPVTALGGSAAEGERRQLQFATPGGTRIIWIFDQNLRLQESMP